MAKKKKSSTGKRKACRKPTSRSTTRKRVSEGQASSIMKIYEGILEKMDEVMAMKGAREAVEKVRDLVDQGGIFVQQIQLLARMVMDAIRGDYETPWKTIAAAGAALLYFVSPIDLIPDFIPLVGYVDDAWLLFFVCTSLIGDDLRDYCRAKRLKLKSYGLA